MRANLCPSEVMIVEDSHVGRKAALRSGCHLCPVENPDNLTLELLTMRAEHINLTQANPPVEPSETEAMNIVVPMAAPYEDFKKLGFQYPAPLIEGTSLSDS